MAEKQEAANEETIDKKTAVNNIQVAKCGTSGFLIGLGGIIALIIYSSRKKC